MLVNLESRAKTEFRHATPALAQVPVLGVQTEFLDTSQNHQTCHFETGELALSKAEGSRNPYCATITGLAAGKNSSQL
jgi:hypothetical protein